MQYTIRDIPEDVDKALRARARSEGKSLNQTVVNALRLGLRLDNLSPKKRDLSDVFGKSKPDPRLDKALAECRQID